MKPLRAFPFPLNVGTDICHIAHIYDILRGPRAARLVGRILTEGERRHAASRLAPLSWTTTTTTTANAGMQGDGAGRDAVGKRDPDVWKMAAFVAGR